MVVEPIPGEDAVPAAPDQRLADLLRVGLPLLPSFLSVPAAAEPQSHFGGGQQTHRHAGCSHLHRSAVAPQRVGDSGALQVTGPGQHAQLGGARHLGMQTTQATGGLAAVAGLRPLSQAVMAQSRARACDCSVSTWSPFQQLLPQQFLSGMTGSTAGTPSWTRQASCRRECAAVRSPPVRTPAGRPVSGVVDAKGWLASGPRRCRLVVVVVCPVWWCGVVRRCGTPGWSFSCGRGDSWLMLLWWRVRWCRCWRRLRLRMGVRWCSG